MQCPAEDLEYVRRARRIRARGRRGCAKLHASLRGLARPGERQIPSPPPCRGEWSQSPILGHRGPAARQFADRVSRRLIGGLLTWTNRRILLSEAATLGIGRFDASLIIAAVQHAAKDPHPDPLPEYREREIRTPLTFVGPIATFLAVQLVIIAAVWRLLF